VVTLPTMPLAVENFTDGDSGGRGEAGTSTHLHSNVDRMRLVTGSDRVPRRYGGVWDVQSVVNREGSSLLCV